VRGGPGGRSFGPDMPHDPRGPVGPRAPLLLVPSVYVWPHVRVNCDAPWPLTLVYRAPHVVEGMRPTSDSEVVRIFQALGNQTRLRILKLIAARPRSTQELAQLVALS